MTRSPAARAAIVAAVLAAALAGCGEDVTATVITVSARPAVTTLTRLDVSFANANATLSESFDLRGVTLPTTFSVETPERSGELEVSAIAVDGAGLAAARGQTAVTIRRDDIARAELLLEPDDFLVNTITAQDQALIFFGGNGGRQVAANGDGLFTIGFSDDCGEFGRCDVWGRNYDARAVAQPTTVAAGPAQYNFNRSQVFGTDPAVAVGPGGHRLALWISDTQPEGSVPDVILCSALDPAGAPTTVSEVAVSTGPDGAPSVAQPSITALGRGRYVATWNQLVANPAAPTPAFVQAILAVILDDNCQPQPNGIDAQNLVFQVSTSGGALDHPVVAGDGARFGFVWGNGDGLRGRFTDDSGHFGGPETTLIPDDGPLRWGQQLVFTGDGFMLSYGVLADDDGGAQLRLRPISLAGVAAGAESVLEAGAVEPLEATALARRSDGAIAVAWHACDIEADPECGVLGQLVRPTALPVGGPFRVNTTTKGRQSDPSIAALPDAFVVAWTDSSGLPPDTSEAGIRARVIYPRFDDATGVIGAACSGGAPCGDGLSCLAGSDGVPHCHPTCDPAAPLCAAGGVCTTSGDVSGCIL